MIEPGPSKQILGDVPCNLCGHTEYVVKYPNSTPDFDSEEEWLAFSCTHSGYGVHGQIVSCTNCDFIFTSPRHANQQFTANYESVEDPLYLQERPAREITFRKHLQHLEKCTGPGAERRLLDVGAYIGVFVEAANAAGWQASGIEPSDWAVGQAQKSNLDVIQGFFPPAAGVFEHESFDVITMWDVIEHVTEPDATLRAAYELLKPGGWVVVHTMDIDSLFANVMGKRWPWLMEMHIFYFSRRTLGRMLENAGFEVVRIKPEGRYLRLKYLVTRLRPYSKVLADFIEWASALVGLDKVALPINFGDLVTAYAYKPEQK